MICYDTFVKLFIKYINQNIKKQVFYSVCDSGKNEIYNYSIRVDIFNKWLNV